MRTCKRCGKSCGAFSCEIEPDPRIPEIKRTLRFCSAECANRFLGTIAARRNKDAKRGIRAELEKADRQIKDGDVREIFLTLKPREKDQLAAVGIGTILAECGGNLSRFYRRLEELGQTATRAKE